MTRPLRRILLVVAAAWLGWVALVRRTGDSRMVWQSDQLDELQLVRKVGVFVEICQNVEIGWRLNLC